MGVRDSTGMQSVFARRTRLDVQESAIMRFVGSLASHAVGDLDEKVEIEEDRFLHDGFTALQADARALGGRWRAEAGAPACGGRDQRRLVANVEAESAARARRNWRR